MDELNLYQVPKKQWNKWDDYARRAFNVTYESILATGPDCFLHPTTVSRGLNLEEFNAIAWNSAWLAADTVKSMQI